MAYSRASSSKCPNRVRVPPGRAGNGRHYSSASFAPATSRLPAERPRASLVGVGAERDGPSGVVAFALTDIEGSTKLARALGDEYTTVIGRHNEVLEAVWRTHGGYVFGTRGDSFLVAFGDPDAAVLAAIDAQRAITDASWPGDRDVRIRVGLHAGYARCVEGDYHALSINQAARIVDTANGGQTFATDAVVALQFDGPVQLHAVRAAGMPQVDAAPRVRPAEGHNMVRPTTVLVGREADVASTVARLRPRVLTTIAGPGGVGKTRLAVEAAMGAVPDWPDGVWFVDLTSVVSADDVPSAVAVAVGASIAPGEDVWQEVLTHLEHRTALVVLDNCEHVAEGVAPLVGDLLTLCPGVGVLASSRTPLGLVAEHVHRLEPLAVDTELDPGVQLFLVRAAGDPDRLRRDDVVALCRELAGLPLAIELAAARTSAISPGEILRRLRSAPAVLRSRDPGLPERHRSLQRSLDWSYGLLEPAARCVYRRLSVFASSFDLEAAEQVCAGDADGGEVAVDHVAELVWGLVDASLVQSDEAAGETRYRMLTVMRAHAGSLTSDEEASVAMGGLARLELDRIGPDHPTDLAWRSAMSVELDNVRQVVVTLGASTDADVLLTHHASGRRRALSRNSAEGAPSAPCERRRAGGTAPRRGRRHQTLCGTGASSDIASRRSGCARVAALSFTRRSDPTRVLSAAQFGHRVAAVRVRQERHLSDARAVRSPHVR